MMKRHYFVYSALFLMLFVWFAPRPAWADNRTDRMRDFVDRWVERIEERVARMMDRYCERFEKYNEKYGSRLPEFCGVEEPSPSPTPSPSPSPSVSPSVLPSPSPSPSPSPEPTGGLVLSEVYYDVDAEHGAETANEWVEIYNSSDVVADVSGYILEDATGNSDALPEGTTMPANGYLVVVSDSATTGFWTIPGSASVVALDSAIGNGLGNTGDAVFLKDVEGVELDDVSWGSNVDAFDPAVSGVAAGSSVARVPVTTDTNTAADWTELEAPTPGE